jgi:hypothetical protein
MGAMMTHSIIQPPFTLRFREMSKKNLEAYRAPPLDKTNPISPTNPNRRRYMDAAEEFLNGGAP